MLRADARPTEVTDPLGNAERRLIETAERLFADHGVGAVSLRAVMNEAGTNIAAVHYHFGSKQALLEAILASRLPQIAAARTEIVQELSAAERVSVRDVAEALVRPAIMVLESGGEHWLRLLHRLLGSDHRDLAEASVGFHARNAELVDRLMAVSDGVPRPAVDFRLAQAMGITLDVLSDLERTRSLMSSKDEEWSREDVLANLLDVVTAVLAGPPDHSAKVT